MTDDRRSLTACQTIVTSPKIWHKSTRGQFVYVPRIQKAAKPPPVACNGPKSARKHERQQQRF